jgi:hypothetical protein
MRLLEGKRNNTDIADEVGVSIQTVKNYSANLASFGDILPPKISRIGRPPILTQAMVDVRSAKTIDIQLIHLIGVTEVY